MTVWKDAKSALSRLAGQSTCGLGTTAGYCHEILAVAVTLAVSNLRVKLTEAD